MPTLLGKSKHYRGGIREVSKTTRKAYTSPIGPDLPGLSKLFPGIFFQTSDQSNSVQVSSVQLSLPTSIWGSLFERGT